MLVLNGPIIAGDTRICTVDEAMETYYHFFHNDVKIQRNLNSCFLPLTVATVYLLRPLGRWLLVTITQSRAGKRK